MISLSGDEATKSYQMTIFSLEEQKNLIYKELIETKSSLEISENKLKSLQVITFFSNQFMFVDFIE